MNNDNNSVSHLWGSGVPHRISLRFVIVFTCSIIWFYPLISGLWFYHAVHSAFEKYYEYYKKCNFFILDKYIQKNLVNIFYIDNK